MSVLNVSAEHHDITSSSYIASWFLYCSKSNYYRLKCKLYNSYDEKAGISASVMQSIRIEVDLFSTECNADRSDRIWTDAKRFDEDWTNCFYYYFFFSSYFEHLNLHAFPYLLRIRKLFMGGYVTRLLSFVSQNWNSYIVVKRIKLNMELVYRKMSWRKCAEYCIDRYMATNARYNLSQLMRLWFLSHSWPAKAQASLRIRTVAPEPSLFAHMKYEIIRRVRPKNQTSSPSGCRHMRVWRMSLRRTKTAIISWAGSFIR